MPESQVDLDEQLLSALKSEPRASVLALSRTTGAPRAVVARHLKQMFDSQDVRVVAALHPNYSGLNVVAHISVATEGPVEPVLKMATALHESVLVSVIAGAYDLILEVRVRTHEELNALLSDIRSTANVSRINTVIYSTIYKGKLEHRKFESISVDGIDRELLGELQQDGRKSWQDLAQDVGLSPSAARARVHRILESGIAQLVVVQTRGGEYNRAFSCGVGMTLNADPADVLPQLKDKKSVEFAVSTVGRFDAILAVRCTTPVALHEFLEGLRGMQEVSRLETWHHLRSAKEDYTRRL